MAAIYRHGNTLMIDHVPSNDVSAGDVIVAGSECRIAHTDLEKDQLGAIAAPAGTAVYTVNKKAAGSGQAINDGAAVYWDAANKEAVNTDASGANKKLGMAIAGALTTDTTVTFRHAV